MSWLQQAAQQIADAPRRRFLSELNDFLDSEKHEHSSLNKRFFSTQLKLNSPYWRLQHCWCILEKDSRGIGAADAQKNFKKDIWKKSMSSLDAKQVFDIVVAWCSTTQSKLHSSLNMSSAASSPRVVVPGHQPSLSGRISPPRHLI